MGYFIFHEKLFSTRYFNTFTYETAKKFLKYASRPNLSCDSLLFYFYMAYTDMVPSYLVMNSCGSKVMAKKESQFSTIF